MRISRCVCLQGWGGGVYSSSEDYLFLLVWVVGIDYIYRHAVVWQEKCLQKPHATTKHHVSGLARNFDQKAGGGGGGIWSMPPDWHGIQTPAMFITSGKLREGSDCLR